MAVAINNHEEFSLSSEVKKKMLTRVSLNPDRHQKLPGVPLCVFGGVEQKTENRGWKTPATYKSRLRQNRFIDGPKLIHR
jgi:hypothetical protein